MRFVPLALFLAAAPFVSAFTCTVIDDGADCASTAELCPNLQCEDGFATNEDGCALCECAMPALDGGPGDDGGTSFTKCSGDSECSAGQHCDTVNFCESACGEARPGEPSDCPAVCLGRCVDGPAPDQQCASDFDCAPNQICSFDGGAPAPGCEPGTNCDGDLVAPPGRCVDVAPQDVCFSDGDCNIGEVCSFDGGGGGAAAPCDPSVGCDPPPLPPPEGRCVVAEPEDGGPGPTDGGPAPGCFSDDDCQNGFCDVAAPNQCVFNNCDDDSQAICAMPAPSCPVGQTAAVRSGCWECVDARTCGALP